MARVWPSILKGIWYAQSWRMDFDHFLVYTLYTSYFIHLENFRMEENFKFIVSLSGFDNKAKRLVLGQSISAVTRIGMG